LRFFIPLLRAVSTTRAVKRELGGVFFINFEFNSVGLTLTSPTPGIIRALINVRSAGGSPFFRRHLLPQYSSPSDSFATMPTLEEPKNEARLLLVSNRLPITIKRSEDGKYDFSMSSGGLVSGLSGLSKSTTFQWYGWPGLEVPEPEIPEVKQRLKDEYGAVPVFIDDDLADRHYNGFSSQ
jgi:hypothetical protein